MKVPLINTLCAGLVAWLLVGCSRRLDVYMTCAAEACNPVGLRALFEQEHGELRVGAYIAEGSAERPLRETATASTPRVGMPAPEQALFTRWISADTDNVDVALALFDRCGQLRAAGAQRGPVEGLLPSVKVPIRLLPGTTSCAAQQDAPIQELFIASATSTSALAGFARGPLALPRELRQTEHRVEVLGWGFRPDTQVWLGGRLCPPELCVRIDNHLLDLRIDPLEQGTGPLALRIEVPAPTDGKSEPSVTERCDLITLSTPSVDFLDGGTVVWHLADPQSQTSLQPVALALGDVDGDGRDDAVLATQANRGLTILRSRPGGPFVSHDFQIVPLGAAPADVTIADLYGHDGQLDIAALAGGHLYLLRNRGSAQIGSTLAARFDHAKPLALPSGDGTGRLLSADLNNNQYPDLVVTLSSSNRVLILLDPGLVPLQDSPQVWQSLEVPGNPQALAAGDLDGDGFPELVVALPSKAALMILRNQGDGRFVPMQPALMLAGKPTAVALADLDGDAQLDIIATEYTERSLAIFLRKTEGSRQLQFRSRPQTGVGDHPVALAAADVDHDGAPDLAVVLEESEGTLVVLRNTRDDRLLEPVVYKHARQAEQQRLAVGYFDGRGSQACTSVAAALPDFLVLNPAENALPTLAAFINSSR